MANHPSAAVSHNPRQLPAADTADDALNENEMEVELASAGERVKAFLINVLIFGITVLPMCYVFLPFVHLSNNDGLVAFFKGAFLSILFLLILIVWQISWMGTYGQSIGKRIMHIKVIRQNGEKANFLSVVLIREVVFYFISTFIMSLIAFPIEIIAIKTIDHSQSIPVMTDFILFQAVPQCLPYFVCLIMLFFPSHGRRTAQDYLAQTVVIKCHA